MKKIVFLFLSLLTAGCLFQACNKTKTYAELLEDEKKAVERFISDSAIHVISLDDFRRNDSVTKSKAKGDDYDEFVAFPSEGVYMQIIDRGNDGKEGYTAEEKEADKFKDGNSINVRYVELKIDNRELRASNVPLEGRMNVRYYAFPLVFRYVKSETYAAGTFTEMDYMWSLYGTTAVPQGWLVALPYLRNNAHVRLIVPSKMGHNKAQQAVTPFFYDLRELTKAKS